MTWVYILNKGHLICFQWLNFLFLCYRFILNGKFLLFLFRCPADSDLGIVVELQTSGGPASDYDKHSLITRAWTKLPLFDGKGQLIAGKFRIPFRNVPIKPYLHPSQLQNLEKVCQIFRYF